MNMLCPVCHKRVDHETAPRSDYHGITYAFRCPHCKERFDADPERFLGGSEREGCAHGDTGCAHQGGQPEHRMAGDRAP